jgi:hypothetical protein
LWCFQPAGCGSQAHIGGEHAADPNDGAEYVQGEQDGEHKRVQQMKACSIADKPARRPGSGIYFAG